MQFIFGELLGLENLCLKDLLPTSRLGLQPFVSSGDEELFRVTAKTVVELLDCGATDPFWVAESLAYDNPSLVAKHGRQAIEGIAELILASQIPGLSSSFQLLFDTFNQEYFSGVLDRYQVLIVFDVHIFDDEPVDDDGIVISGLIRFDERRIYIRYTDTDSMQKTLIHEMAHAATSGEHDERWRNEMVRLKHAGAPVRDSELDP